jgi:hypothetical protein
MVERVRGVVCSVDLVLCGFRPIFSNLYIVVTVNDCCCSSVPFRSLARQSQFIYYNKPYYDEVCLSPMMKDEDGGALSVRASVWWLHVVEIPTCNFSCC